MNYKMIGRLTALILAAEAVFMIPSLLICVFDGDTGATKAFLYTLAIILAAALILHLLSRRAKTGFYAREGLVCVAFSWMALSLFGCLPFVLSGGIPSFIDALFETVSGFTTTGASVLSNPAVLPRGLLFWRSFSHWVGGMGVLVFILAIVPISGRNDGFSVHLLRAESPGPNVGKLVPRMRQTAKILYLLYIGLTVTNIVFLLFGGMPLFDSLCTAFGTAGTGGFGIRADSIAGYSPYIQTVCTVFMLLFGINFGCYYLLLIGKLRDFFRDEEIRVFVCVVLASMLLITFNIRGSFSSFGEAFHSAAFHVSSIITTTGYTISDFGVWPSFSRAMLLFLMFFGACAGSTGGGIKCSRVIILFKSLRRSIRQVLHPQEVHSIQMNRHVLDEKVVENTNAYLSVYVIIGVLSFILISVDGHSIETNISAVLACFNNIGPGLDVVGPSMNYSAYGTFSKIVLIFDMLAGRLEIFPILALFSRRTWRKRAL